MTLGSQVSRRVPARLASRAHRTHQQHLANRPRQPCRQDLADLRDLWVLARLVFPGVPSAQQVLVHRYYIRYMHYYGYTSIFLPLENLTYNILMQRRLI